MPGDATTVLATATTQLGYGAKALLVVVSSAGSFIDISDSNATWVTVVVAGSVIGGVVLAGISVIRRLASF